MTNITEKSEIVFIFILLNSFVWAGGGAGGNIAFLDIITVAFIIGFLMFVIRKYFNKMIDSWEDERIENIKTTNKEIETMNEEIVSMNEEIVSMNEDVETMNEEIKTMNEDVEIKNINEDENNFNSF